MYMYVEIDITYPSCIYIVPHSIPMSKMIAALDTDHALHLSQNDI